MNKLYSSAILVTLKSFISAIQEQRRAKAHDRQAKQARSIPRSAWECILDALRPVYWATEIRAQGTQSVPYAFPRSAWDRVFIFY